LVAMALGSKAITLGQLGRLEEAVDAYDKVIADYGDAPELELRKRVAKALVDKGVTLGRPEQAVGVLDKVIAEYGDVPKPEMLREQVAKALVNRASRWVGPSRRWMSGARQGVGLPNHVVTPTGALDAVEAEDAWRQPESTTPILLVIGRFSVRIQASAPPSCWRSCGLSLAG